MLCSHESYILFYDTQNNSVWLFYVNYDRGCFVTQNYLVFVFLNMIFPPFLSNKSCEKINTPAVLIFILLSHDDVETHASMAFWRTNEIDIYLFWLCIQIWYLIFDIWFSFLFYFSVPFFSLFSLCFWESFSFERFCLNMLTDWKHTFFNDIRFDSTTTK